MLWFMFVLRNFFNSLIASQRQTTRGEARQRATTTATLAKNFAFDVIKQAHMVTHDDTDFIASHLLAKCHRKKTLKLRDWCVILFLFVCLLGGWFDKEFIVQRANSFLNPAVCHYSFSRFVYFTRLSDALVSFDVRSKYHPPFTQQVELIRDMAFVRWVWGRWIDWKAKAQRNNPIFGLAVSDGTKI